MVKQKSEQKAEAVKPHGMGDQVNYNGLACKVTGVVVDPKHGPGYTLETPSGATVHAVKHARVTKVA